MTKRSLSFSHSVKRVSDLADIRLTFDGYVIKPVPIVMTLGAYVDAALNMDSHVCAVAKFCFSRYKISGGFDTSYMKRNA